MATTNSKKKAIKKAPKIAGAGYKSITKKKKKRS